MSAERSVSKHSEQAPRMNYKILNNTGEKVILQTVNQAKEQSHKQKLYSNSLVKESSLTDITSKMENLKVDSNKIYDATQQKDFTVD